LDADGELTCVVLILGEVTGRLAAADQLQFVVTTDALTGAANRRHFNDAAAREFQRARRYDRALAVLWLDVDHLQLVNDLHGPHMGDQVLEVVAGCVKSLLRTTDVFGRVGGDEFAVLLPETAVEAARFVAERIRQSLTQTRVELGSEFMAVAVSMGVSGVENEDRGFDDVASRAQAAVSTAKQLGRARVEVARPGATAKPPKAQNVA
jgi:diguanylate cyclase (GGDEF)-like protein